MNVQVTGINQSLDKGKTVAYSVTISGNAAGNYANNTVAITDGDLENLSKNEAEKLALTEIIAWHQARLDEINGATE